MYLLLIASSITNFLENILDRTKKLKQALEKKSKKRVADGREAGSINTADDRETGSNNNKADGGKATSVNKANGRETGSNNNADGGNVGSNNKGQVDVAILMFAE